MPRMTLAEFIAALGGNDAVAKLFDVERTTPYTWIKRGLPARFHMRALRIAQAQGLAFDPETEGGACEPLPPKPRGRRAAPSSTEPAEGATA